jgi:hypothetical protein
MKMALNDPNTNWKFVGIAAAVGLAAAGWMITVL